MEARELLLTRRSIRQYDKKEVSHDVLSNIFELTRYAPSANNSQPCYYIVIKEENELKKLGNIRGGSSAPIERAPMAIAICSDPSISSRYIQDGCIGAYNFMLSAKVYGLGTCWIADMDRDEVKEILGIPKNHYVVTVTPVGYPAENGEVKPRKTIKEIVRNFIYE